MIILALVRISRLDLYNTKNGHLIILRVVVSYVREQSAHERAKLFGLKTFETPDWSTERELNEDKDPTSKQFRGADKSLTRPKRKQVTATKL
jgi:hypothetical protein